MDGYSFLVSAFDYFKCYDDKGEGNEEHSHSVHSVDEVNYYPVIKRPGKEVPVAEREELIIVIILVVLSYNQTAVLLGPHLLDIVREQEEELSHSYRKGYEDSYEGGNSHTPQGTGTVSEVAERVTYHVRHLGKSC